MRFWHGPPSGASSLAARPAANTLPPGTLWLVEDDDGGTLFRTDGSTWTKAAAGVSEGGGGGGGGGALAFIGRVVVGAGGAASVSFDSIPGTYESLHLVGSARAERATTFHVLTIRFNDDAGGNYNFNNIFSSGSVVDDSVSTGQTAGRAGVVAAGNAPANTFGAFETLMPGYARTDRHKTILWRSGTRYGTGGNDFRHDTGHSAWQSTAAITKITLRHDTSDDIAEGSAFTLYGLVGS